MHISLFYLPYNTIIFYGSAAALTEDADTTEAVWEGVENFRGQLAQLLCLVSKAKTPSLFLVSHENKTKHAFFFSSMLVVSLCH